MPVKKCGAIRELFEFVEGIPIWIRDDRMRYLRVFKTGQIRMIFH